MHSLYKSRSDFISQRQKEVTVDKYDTDSDEEDHRREEEEIKRIIMKSRIKAASKPKINEIEIAPNDTTNNSKIKLDSFATPNASVPSKAQNLKGFFPTTMNSQVSVDRKDLSQELERTLEKQKKKPSKFSHKPKDIRALLEMDVNYSGDELEGQNLLTKTSETSTTRLPQIRNVPKNQDFQKESFNNLLSLYSRSTSTHPIALFTEKTYLSSKAAAALGLEELSKRASKSPVQISFNPNLGPESVNEVGSKKKIKDIIPDLISGITANAWEPLNPKDPYEVPRLKMIDWPSIIKKNNSKKLQLLIIDPINFEIEDCIEINAENPQDVKDIVNEAIREVLPDTNEAKQILVYHIDEVTGEKKLLLTKFFFFLKNHRSYNKNFKNEKEVIMYYTIILGLLELRVNYETNPFKQEKIETSKKKALNLSKKTENFPMFVCDWLVNKVQPTMVVEKVYVNLNVGGKADSNFTFSMHEHLAYTFPKIAKILHEPKSHNSPKPSPANYAEKRFGSGPSTMRTKDDKDKSREISILPIPKSPLDTTARDLKTTQRNTHRSTEQAKKKMELSMSIVDIANNDKKDESLIQDSNAKVLTQPGMTNLVSAAGYTPQQAYQHFVAEKERESVQKTMWPRKLGPLGDEKQKLLSDKHMLIQNMTPDSKHESKVYLSKQRMNTSYGQLLKHRFAKRNVWSQKL